jgi:serine/threonine-protein kinase
VTSTADFVNSAGDIGAGHVLGRYELLMPIASGGMAMVWAARLKGSRGFQKLVAVKTMLPKLSEDEQFEQMFLDEASLASQIRHPHVVEILDLGEEDGILYLVMELVDGVPLNQLMKAAKKRGGIPLPVSVRVVMQACAGLHAAHELKDRSGQLVGLVHRDVSPQNVLVTYDGVTKVVDFGIAKATALGGGATMAGQIKGKVAYMAPEQVKGTTLDRRVDVFAIGIVLYALTTGKHPLRRESEAATMYNICSPEPVMPPSKIVSGYPAQLERIVMQALQKDPAKRYPTANDVLRALDALPPTMRAGTDEDVGTFVRTLFAERREERQGALQQALDLADLQTEERRSLSRAAAASLPPGSLAPGAGSSVGNTITPSRVSLTSATDIQSSLDAEKTAAASRQARAAQARQGWMVGAIVGAVVFSGGIIAAAVLSSRPNPVVDMSVTQAHGEASADRDVRLAPASSASAKQVEDVGVDPGALPTEAPPSASAAPNSVPVAGHNTGLPGATLSGGVGSPAVAGPLPGARTPSAPAGEQKPPAGKKGNAWNKQDPGF